MTEKSASNHVEGYVHHSSKRSNLPTDQTGKIMSDEEKRPILYTHHPPPPENENDSNDFHIGTNHPTTNQHNTNHPTTNQHNTNHPDVNDYLTVKLDADPVLAWNRQPSSSAGHAAHPLYVREKIHPAVLVNLLKSSSSEDSSDVRGRSVGQAQSSTQAQLFKDFNGLPSPDAAYEWYQHTANWQNRLIHGESVRVMASLLAREHMAGKVQMIYFDPPYGMGYNSNFQVSVGDREVPNTAKGRPHGTRTIRAFRDTYERGIHSYLDLTLEKLTLMRQLLTDTGSLFMQIGDENVLRVGLLLDEVFGAENRVSLIPYATTGGSSAKTLPSVTNFLLWYAKDKQRIKYRQLFEPLTRTEIVQTGWSVMLELQDGTTRSLTKDERSNPDTYIPDGARLYQRMPLASPGTSRTGRSEPYLWHGNEYPCPAGQHWRVSTEGMDRLAELGRLDAAKPGSSLSWKRYENEIPGRRINNMWHKPMSPSDKRYVVQTSVKVIERCLLMCSDPGDLVFDPTCGSGTTAFVAESWGRRWITCDTSPVALSIARQRLVTATFPYWVLATPDSRRASRRAWNNNGFRGEDGDSSVQYDTSGGHNYADDDPACGFVYEQVPHVSASVLAYDIDTDPVFLVDKPQGKRGVVRVSSPLTVESEQPWTAVAPFEGACDPFKDACDADDKAGFNEVTAHGDFSKAIETALLHHTINGGRDNSDITIRSLEPWPSTSNPLASRLLAWKAIYTVDEGAAEHCAAVMVAAEDVTVPGEIVREAARETTDSVERVDVLIVVAYAYGPDTPCSVGRVRVARVQINRDLMIRDLSDETGHEAFIILGEPDVRVIDGLPQGQIAVEVIGYDTYDPATGNVAEGSTDDVNCWMIDTNHDGENFFVRRIHFPGAERDRSISKLLSSLGADSISEVERKALTSTRSAPFNPPERRKIAVRIVTTTGMEMTTIKHISHD